MTKASDNIFPKVTFVEGAAPASPAATNFSLYYDSADHLLKWKNSAGTVTTIATGTALADQGVFTYLDGTVAAAPGTPAAGKLRVYAKTGKVLAVKDDAGVETVLGAGAAATTLNMVQWSQALTNTSLTVTMGATPTIGNIIVLASVCNGTADLTSVTQTNVTWTKMKSGGTPDAATKINIWIGKVAASASTTVTIVRPGGNAMWSVVEYVYSGTITPTLGQSATQSSYPTTVPLLMAATTANNLIVFMAAGANQNAGSLLFPSLGSAKGMRLSMAAVVCALSDGGAVALSAFDVPQAPQGGGALIAEIT